MDPRKSKTFNCEIFILAGGLSSRMGRDKSGLRLGSQTMLGHVRATATQLGLPVRVIRRDAVARCGPIGGIYTAFKRSRAEVILFLACDMPFVSPALLKKMLRNFRSIAGETGRNTGIAASAGLFASAGGRAGFPCLLRREAAFAIVRNQIQNSQFSLQALAKKLRAKTMRPLRSPARQLANINTPAELEQAARFLDKSRRGASHHSHLVKPGLRRRAAFFSLSPRGTSGERVGALPFS